MVTRQPSGTFASRTLAAVSRLMLLLFLLSCSKEPSSPETGTISGVATLEDSSQHAGIVVRLLETGQTVTTASSGQFTISQVAVGTYTLEAAKEGYGSVTRGDVHVRSGQTTPVDEMKLLMVLSVSGAISSDTIWDSGRHIVLTDDVTVQSGAILRIQNAVQARFYNGTSLTIEGTLIATASDSAQGILFTAFGDDPSAGAWNRILFKDLAPGNGSRMSFCTIEYASSGIICNSASPTITDCRILSCDYTGILCSNSSALIENNHIDGCQYGIRCEAGSDGAVIQNNRFTDNEEVGLACLESSPHIVDNLVDGSAYGIWCEYRCFPLIEHNELTGNGTGIHIFTVSAPTITKNYIHHNTDAILANNGSYPVANYNNITDHDGWSFFLNNSSTYPEQNVDARNNWWGTVEISAIEQQIRDKNDVTPGLPIGLVIYDPVLASPDPTAGLLP